MTVMDQATSLRAMAGRSDRRAQTIAITSGKGGVGKTNLSVNLATVLAAMRRKVVLLDADLGLANADILCNVQPRFNPRPRGRRASGCFLKWSRRFRRASR